jgi:acetyl-CoA C-acetyltransferase
MNQAFIYEAIRTPRGRAKDSGGLYDLTPLDLMKALYDAMVECTGIDKNKVDDVILGCVTQAVEQAANIAKTSLMYAGWPDQVPGITVNRFCSSGLDAINFAALKVNAGQAAMTLAGGVEMMSRVPMLSDKASVFSDPKLATQCRMLMMGSGADLIASLYDVSREEADGIALQSQQRAAKARDEGFFKSIVPVENKVKGITVSQDECIRDQTTLESLAAMEPAFAGLGAKGIDAFQLSANKELSEISHVHTAGNSPAMCDGAALLLVGDESVAETYGLKPRAKIVAATSVCDDPLKVISGCAAATQKLMDQQGLTSADVDLFELHEAFAATVIKCQRDLDISEDKLNVNGGVIALGHPMGATGAIMAGTLLDELERRDQRVGIVAASGAGGTGTAMLIERC